MTSQPPQPDGQQRGEPFGLKMRAAFKPGSINAEDRTVEVVFGSDKPVRMYTWEYGPINEELSFDASHVRMDRLNSGAPVLDNHDAYGSVLDTVVGVVEKAWSDGKKGYAKLRFAKTDKGDKMLEMARDGILQNVSVGYAVHKYMRSKSNEDGKLDNYKAVDWEPHEISMVAVPADADAKLRSLAGGGNDVVIEDAGSIDISRMQLSGTNTTGSTITIAGGSGIYSTTTAGLARSAEMYDAEMEGPKGQIETCTDAINELNEEIENSLAAAEAYPEQADLYAAVVAAHKAAISAHLEVIAAVNGQRSTNDTINQRSQQVRFLLARYPHK